MRARKQSEQERDDEQDGRWAQHK